MVIDGRDPNPMKDPEDIAIYNRKIQEMRLFQLLIVVDERFETLKMDLLKHDPLPSVEAAFAAIWREDARMGIFRGIPSEITSSLGIGFGLKL